MVGGGGVQELADAQALDEQADRLEWVELHLLEQHLDLVEEVCC